MVFNVDAGGRTLSITRQNLENGISDIVQYVAVTLWNK